MKKLYNVITVDTVTGEEWETYLGTNLEEAKEAKRREDINYSNSTKRDQERTAVELRVYEIDDVNTDDADELIEAIIEATGYDII